MVALAEIDDAKCSGCGGDLHETLGTEPEDWIGIPPAQCGKCALIGMQQDAFGGTQKQSYRWGAKRRHRRG